MLFKVKFYLWGNSKKKYWAGFLNIEQSSVISRQSEQLLLLTAD